MLTEGDRIPVRTLPNGLAYQYRATPHPARVFAFIALENTWSQHWIRRIIVELGWPL